MEQNNKKETRNIQSPLTLARAAEEGVESRTVEGYALRFGVHSDGLPFDEVIEHGALDGVIARSDVLAVLNHNTDRGVLARSRNGVGSLELTVDEVGLKYRFEAPHTALGDELLENIRRGEVFESSFCFTVKRDSWDYQTDGPSRRVIHEIDKLFDVSPVYNAAYSATSVYTRGLDEARARAEEEESKAAATEATNSALRKLFS